MATMIACDQCGKQQAENTGLVGWWLIDAAGVSLERLGEPVPPWHLCSWACVAAFAEKQQPDVDGEEG